MAYPAERGWSPAVKPGATSLTRADDRAVAEDLLREAVSDALGDAAERVEHRVVADSWPDAPWSTSPRQRTPSSWSWRRATG